MKIIISIVLAIIVFSGIAFGANYTKGSWRDTDRDGVKDTYVDGYYKTAPNNSKLDNYSTKGNVNPFTGKEGTVNPNNNDYNNSYNNSGYGSKSLRNKNNW